MTSPIIPGSKRFTADELANLDVNQRVILIWRGGTYTEPDSITDAQWDQVCSLLCAAPHLLAVLRQIVDDTNEFLDVSSDADTFADRMRANCEDAERAIAKANGGAK